MPNKRNRMSSKEKSTIVEEMEKEARENENKVVRNNDIEYNPPKED